MVCFSLSPPSTHTNIHTLKSTKPRYLKTIDLWPRYEHYSITRRIFLEPISNHLWIMETMQRKLIRKWNILEIIINPIYIIFSIHDFFKKSLFDECHHYQKYLDKLFLTILWAVVGQQSTSGSFAICRTDRVPS